MTASMAEASLSPTAAAPPSPRAEAGSGGRLPSPPTCGGSVGAGSESDEDVAGRGRIRWQWPPRRRGSTSAPGCMAVGLHGDAGPPRRRVAGSGAPLRVVQRRWAWRSLDRLRGLSLFLVFFIYQCGHPTGSENTTFIVTMALRRLA